MKKEGKKRLSGFFTKLKKICGKFPKKQISALTIVVEAIYLIFVLKLFNGCQLNQRRMVVCIGIIGAVFIWYLIEECLFNIFNIFNIEEDEEDEEDDDCCLDDDYENEDEDED